MFFVLTSLLLFTGLAILGLESLKIAGSSAFYPQILIGAGLVFLICSWFQTWRTPTAIPDDPELSSLIAGTRTQHARFALFCLIWVAYPLVAPWIGFTASTIAVLYGSALVFHTRHRVLSLIGVTCFAILFTIALKSIIYVPVPEAWPDQFINRFMYRVMN